MATPAKLSEPTKCSEIDWSETVEGKEASKQGALKHGCKGTGVIPPGKDELEIAIRVTAREARHELEGDIVATLLIRQFAMALIRAERAYRQPPATLKRITTEMTFLKNVTAELASFGNSPWSARNRNAA